MTPRFMGILSRQVYCPLTVLSAAVHRCCAYFAVATSVPAVSTTCTDTAPDVLALYAGAATSGTYFSYVCPPGSLVASITAEFFVGWPNAWGNVVCGDGTRSSEAWGTDFPQWTTYLGPFTAIGTLVGMVTCADGYATAGYRGTHYITGILSIGPICRKREYSWRHVSLLLDAEAGARWAAAADARALDALGRGLQRMGGVCCGWYRHQARLAADVIYVRHHAAPCGNFCMLF